MSSGAVQAAVTGVIEDEWDESAAPVRKSNTAFDPGGRPWMEFRFPGARTRRGDIGDAENPLWDEAGAFMVDCYVPQGVGTEAATQLADAVWDLLKGREIGGVRIDERMQGSAGPRDPDGVSGVWWGVSFGVAYRYLNY